MGALFKALLQVIRWKMTVMNKWKVFVNRVI